MAGATPDIQQILEQLRGGTPVQQSNYPPPGAYGYPQPSSSGTVDLSAIKPVNSGTVSIQDAIAKAKAVAAANNLAPYERPPVYAGSDGRRRSRSRSPPRREAFHDNYNPYRDERRADRAPRDHGRERSYSPGPRGRQGGGAFSPRGSNSARQRSPLRGEDDSSSETMQIEATLVGLIIGRQGENLRRVEGETKCRVQFLAPHSGDDKFRQCKITGPRARRAEAKAAINRIIDDSGMGAIARAGLDRGQPRPPPTVDPTSGQINLKDGEECLQIMVPDRTVGLIIGRGGETIRDLQERSGCHVNIVGESKSVNGLRPVNLIGPYAAAAQAKDLIMEIVDSDSRNGNSGGGGGGGGGNQHQGRPNQRDNSHDKINDAIFVPNEAVGMIIGKGGETIREMQNQTGCKINVSQQPAPGEAEREIELVGNRDAIERAKRAIEDKVEAVRQKSNGGGGGGGGGGAGRGRGQHRDYDNPSYGQPPSNNQQPRAPAAQAGADGQADPYAPYGGYQNYLALWYQSLAAQQANAGQGEAPKPPGTS
ncbi:hypothetical protein SLS63_001552 [Diaporthe eres]|uniref:K Homology domain-containing protein n=1 Tax=Diaporthe eres TaxID=83184 RepID=A0ABR1PN20_DIAER